MNLEDYKITILFDKNNSMYWDVCKKGVPHYVGSNKEELKIIRGAAEQLKFHIDRLLEANEDLHKEGLL